MTTTLIALVNTAVVGCAQIGRASPDDPLRPADGYLHVFGVHVPALAAVFLTVPLVWFAVEVIHRAGRR